MISRYVIYCDHYPDGAVEAGSNARERKPATVSHEFLLAFTGFGNFWFIHADNAYLHVAGQKTCHRKILITDTL